MCRIEPKQALVTVVFWSALPCQEKEGMKGNSETKLGRAGIWLPSQPDRLEEEEKKLMGQRASEGATSDCKISSGRSDNVREGGREGQKGLWPPRGDNNFTTTKGATVCPRRTRGLRFSPNEFDLISGIFRKDLMFYLGNSTKKTVICVQE